MKIKISTNKYSRLKQKVKEDDFVLKITGTFIIQLVLLFIKMIILEHVVVYYL